MLTERREQTKLSVEKKKLFLYWIIPIVEKNQDANYFLQVRRCL